MNTETTTTDPTNVQASETATTTTSTEPVASTEAATAEGLDGVAKPEGDGDGTSTETKPDDQQPTGAPEAYTDFTLPEGFALDGARLETATGFFRESNLTQAQAQAAVDLFCKLAGDDATALTSALDTARATRIEEWGKQAKDQLGDKYDATVDDARMLLQAYGTPELKEAFDTEGWGNHPELLKVFAVAGRVLKDSGMPGTGGLTSTTAPRSASDVLFDHPTSQNLR